jgi:haloacetate dehalogenase
MRATALDRVDVGEVTLRVRYGGEGEPVVLRHGHPRTHTTWHRVAPRLSGSFFVVCPDLRGYGQSALPPDAPGHAQSSKRAMAGDVVALMRHLGHDRFSVVGHDRGALVAFRTAMDHPDAVKRLVVMDGLPVIEHLGRLNEAFARTGWHWWFLGQTGKPAEAFISADPGRWYRTPPPAEMGAGNHAGVWAALGDPAVVHGTCEDYRAGLRVDRADEEAGRAASRKIRCPMLLLVSTGDDLDIHGDPEAIWRPWAPGEVRSRAIRCGASSGRTGAGRARRGALGFLGRPGPHQTAWLWPARVHPCGSTAGQPASPRKLLMARVLVAASPYRAAGRHGRQGQAGASRAAQRPPVSKVFRLLSVMGQARRSPA